MSQTIEVEPDGIQDALDGILEDVQAQFKDIDYTPMLNEYMTELEDVHRDYFMGQHDPVGNAWPPLKPATIRRKGQDIILFETGKMMDSLTDGTADSIQLVFREGDNSYLVYGTTVEYAHWHMTGTTKMPARPFIGMNDQLLDTLANNAADAAVAALLEGHG